jgi:DNA-binding MarR family transcriptional regulator
MAAGGTSAASDAADVGHLGFEALFASQHMQNQVTRLVDDALARAHDTNLTGFELLSRLERLPADGASVRFLSDHVLLSPSRVSRVVDEFVRRGVLERGASQQDGRLSLVRLTPEGREELAAMRATFNAAIEVHLLQRLTQEQVQALIEIGRAFGAPPCS